MANYFSTMVRNARSITANALSVKSLYSDASFRNSGQMISNWPTQKKYTDEIRVSKVAHSSGQWTKFGVGIKSSFAEKVIYSVPMVCHPSCPMTNPIRDHHHSLDPYACSASEYLSSFPCVEPSSLEVHKHVSLSIPCQKTSSEQEVGYAPQCRMVQPWKCGGHKISRFHWLSN